IYFEVLCTGRLPAPLRADPLARFTRDFHQDLRATAVGGAAWLRRFGQSVHNYLFKGAWAATPYPQRPQTPAVHTYLALREFDCAIYPSIDIAEIALGIFLPHEVVAHEAVRHLRRLCVRCIACTNDLYSYPKERLEHEHPTNVVHCLMVHGALPL